MRKLRYERCINGGKLLCIQLRHNALQRCLRDLAAAFHSGGPPLTDERPNLLISLVGAGGGLEKIVAAAVGLSDEPNTYWQPTNGGQ